MNNPMAGDRARVTVGVALPLEQAFRIFTEEIELWWRRGPRFRCAPGDAGLIALLYLTPYDPDAVNEILA